MNSCASSVDKNLEYKNAISNNDISFRILKYKDSSDL